MRTIIFLIFISLLGCKKDDFSGQVTPKQITLKSISINKPLDTIVISQKKIVHVIGTYTDGSTKDLTDSVTITVESDKLRYFEKVLIAVKSGLGIYNVTYKDKVIKSTTYVSEIEYVDVPELKPRNGTSIVVPVVVINYLPTNDGVNLDMNRAQTIILIYKILPWKERRIKLKRI